MAVGIVVAIVAMSVTAVLAGYRDVVFPIAFVTGSVVGHLLWRTYVGPERIVALRPWGHLGPHPEAALAALWSRHEIRQS